MLVVVFAVPVISLDALVADEVVFIDGVVFAVVLVAVIGDALFVKVVIATVLPFFIALVVVVVLVILVDFD